MKIETTKHLKVKLKGEDIDHFKSALSKVLKDQKKPGFNSSALNEDEVKVLEQISNKAN